MVYDPVRDRMLVFGGNGSGVLLNDVWALSLGDPPVWEQLFSSSDPPSPRMEHSAVFDPVRDRMVVFGGETGTNQFSDELWLMSAAAPTPTVVSFAGADVTSERVRLSWLVPDGSALEADVERSRGDGAWADLGAASREGNRLAFEDREITPGSRYGYRLVDRDGTVLDEAWVTVPAALLALGGASIRPGAADLTVSFSLPGEGRAVLELFDIRGRMLESREVGGLGAGEHQVSMGGGRVPSGVYLIRLRRSERTLTAKAGVFR